MVDISESNAKFLRFSEAKRSTIQPSSDTSSQVRQRALQKVCQYLEHNGDEQITLADLYEKKMKEFCGEDVDAYTRKHLKQKILEYFGTALNLSKRILLVRHMLFYK